MSRGHKVRTVAEKDIPRHHETESILRLGPVAGKVRSAPPRSGERNSPFHRRHLHFQSHTSESKEGQPGKLREEMNPRSPRGKQGQVC